MRVEKGVDDRLLAGLAAELCGFSGREVNSETYASKGGTKYLFGFGWEGQLAQVDSFGCCVLHGRVEKNGESIMKAAHENTTI